MKVDFIPLWTRVLRSGVFPQTKDYLHYCGGYCCLGVALKVAGRLEEVENMDTAWANGLVGEVTGLTEEQADALARLNDDGVPFYKIADTIEEWAKLEQGAEFKKAES